MPTVLAGAFGLAATLFPIPAKAQGFAELPEIAESTPPPSGAFFTPLRLKARRGGATRYLLVKDPVAVLVFSTGPGGVAATDRFVKWATDPGRRYRGTVLAIVVQTSAIPDEVLEEVLSQRDLPIPIFSTSRDLLKGRDTRLLAVRGGRGKDVPADDFAALERDLGVAVDLRVTRAPARPSGIRIEDSRSTPATEPDPAAAQRIIELPDELSASSIPAPTPATTPPPTPISAPTAAATPELPPALAPTPTPIAADAGPYRNARFGLQVVFPDGVRFASARSGDGAVGRPTSPSASADGLDLRVWASAAASDEAGLAVPDRAARFVARRLRQIELETGRRPVVTKRFVVDDEGQSGMEVEFEFVRPASAASAAESAAPPTPVRMKGRLQVFAGTTHDKAVSAEWNSDAPAHATGAVEAFVESFHPYGTP